MKETQWFIREYRCQNGICVKTKFPETGTASLRPGTRRYERSLRKAEKNVTEARHELELTLNENFGAGKDYLVTVTYNSEGYDRLVMKAGTDERDAIHLAARREMENYIRRVRRVCDGLGVELRYVAVTSDLDGVTGEPVRVHHHIVVNWEAAAAFLGKWTAGEAKKKKLYGARNGDLSDLADYLIAQSRVVDGKKRYNPSRNLGKPQAMPVRRARNPEAELKVPKGCELIHRAESNPGRPQRIRYYRPQKEGGRNHEG